jgi:hypothetical protein
MKWWVIWNRMISLVDMRDLFVFGGLAALTYGIAQIHVPAAWIIGGGLTFILGLRR